MKIQIVLFNILISLCLTEFLVVKNSLPNKDKYTSSVCEAFTADKHYEIISVGIPNDEAPEKFIYYMICKSQISSRASESFNKCKRNISGDVNAIFVYHEFYTYEFFAFYEVKLMAHSHIDNYVFVIDGMPVRVKCIPEGFKSIARAQSKFIEDFLDEVYTQDRYEEIFMKKHLKSFEALLKEKLEFLE
jgi:hypothetical protein